MSVVLLALGSRGDVQPMASLGGALRRRGVPATVVALAEYADLVADAGAGFAPVAGALDDALRAVRGPLGRRLASGPMGQGILLRRWAASFAEPFADTVLDAVGEGDAVLSGLLSRNAASALAQARGCRAASVVYTGQPQTQQRESHFFYNYFTKWSAYNRFGTRLNWAISSTVGHALGDAVRQRLGLPRPRRSAAVREADRHPVIVAASPLLVPSAPDWAVGVHQTGYLAPSPSEHRPAAALTEFLGSGEAPVYVGFGSLTGGHSARDVEVIVEAARLSGRRIVTPAVPGLAAGALSSDVLATGSVPHEWLFPRMAGVIHHGGAGTTHEGLRAGVPSVAVPFGVDQPYHGWRLHRLGVGPEPLSIRRLNAERLASLIDGLVASPAASGYARRASEVGAAARAEDGVGLTIDLLDRLGHLP